MKTNLPILSVIVAVLAIASLPGVAQVKKYQEIQYPGLPEFKIPQATILTLSNGLTVYFLEDHELPLIQVNARVRTGSNYEPADKVGLARLMGEVQRTGGTARMTGDQIDDFLASRAATIETGIGDDAGFASMDCLQPDFDEVFRVFLEILRAPIFAADKLDVAKVGETTMIARRNDDVNQITRREIGRLVYGPDSPLSRLTEYATIKAITRDDLVAWHKTYYHPNRILLGVVGDFKAQEMRQKIEVAVAEWPKAPEFVRPPVAYRQTPAPGLYFIEKNDVTQVNIAFGHLGIETKNPDFFAVQVLNEVLGGGFASRLFSNVRSQKGLAYSVYGQVGADHYQPGQFMAGLQTKSQNLTKALDAMKTEINGIIANPPTADELKRAKDSILNSFVFHYDSRRKILAQQMTYAFYGLPPDFLERYRANIEKVTQEDVARVAGQYVHPDQLAILVVGKPADFDQPLANLGKVTQVDIAIPPLPDTTPKTEKTEATRAAGKQLWEKVVKALGGEAFKTLQAFRYNADMVVKMQGQSMTLKQSTIMVFPDKTRQVVTTPMGDQIVVFAGKEGFLKMGDKVQVLPEAAVAEQEKDLHRSLLHLLQNAADPQLETVAAGEETLQGVTCQILALSFKGDASRIWVSPDGQVMQMVYQGANPVTRSPGTITTVYSDYRKNGPFLLAHQQTMRVDGDDVVTVKVETFEVNPQVDPALFKKPAQ